MTTLKEWFLMSGSRCCDVRQRSCKNTDVIPPRILLLDGGVSTHLEEKLRQCRCFTTNNSYVSNSSSIDNDKNDEYVFQYRELWSSSLLLNANGQQQILRGHLDWLQQAKVDVITTVTYQCHYIAPLWPQIKLAISQGQGGEPSRGEPIITNNIMNQMWHDGIRLAQQAVSMVNELPPPLQYPIQRYVVASSGCYGAALSNGAEYTGVYTIAPTQTSTHNDSNVREKTPDTFDENDSPQFQLSQVIYDFHRQKLQAILRNNPTVNGIAIETVPSYLECQVLRDLFLSQDDIVTRELQQSMGHVACYVSLSCRNGSQLNDGRLLVDALQVFRDVPATTLQAIGLNCCSIRYIPNLLRILLTDIVQYTPQRGIVVFPNSGELWDGTTKQWYPDPELDSSTTPMSSGTTTDAVTLMKYVIHEIDAFWEELCRDDSNLRARRKPSILIGGCCRMTVTTIAALRELVDEYIGPRHNES